MQLNVEYIEVIVTMTETTTVANISQVNLLKKGVIAPGEHEKGEYISPIFTTN